MTKSAPELLERLTDMAIEDLERTSDGDLLREEIQECFQLIADLANAASEWEGGHSSGAVYTASRWRAKLQVIAERAGQIAKALDRKST